MWEAGHPTKHKSWCKEEQSQAKKKQTADASERLKAAIWRLDEGQPIRKAA